MPAYTTNGATWSNAFVGVWHLPQTNDAAEAVRLDSAANGNDGTTKNYDRDEAMEADVFDGLNDYVDCTVCGASDHIFRRRTQAWQRLTLRLK